LLDVKTGCEMIAWHKVDEMKLPASTWRTNDLSWFLVAMYDSWLSYIL